MGRIGHQALILGTASVLVAAAGVADILTQGDGPVAAAATTLSSGSDVSLVSPDGHAVSAHRGQRVPDGDVVRTGRYGRATLSTRGREVYLRHSGAMAVLDGAHQQLRTGSAVVDAHAGPGLRLDVANDVVTVPSGSATEALRSVSVVIGSLRGPAQVQSSSGRQLTVGSLSQAVVAGDALPATTTPLHLSDDWAEADAVPTLVGDDVALGTLAQGIDASGSSTVNAVETSWTTGVLPSLRSVPASDVVLPIVIADSTKAAGDTRVQRYSKVVRWRRAGGSWGVVDELLGGHAGAVKAMLTSLLSGGTPGQIGTVSIHALAAPAEPTVRHGQRSGGRHSANPSTSDPTHHPTSSAGGSAGGSGGGGSSPTPTPRPSPSNPIGTLTGTVQGVIGTVLGGLPVKIVPSPSPKPSSSGLLGGVLGGLTGGS